LNHFLAASGERSSEIHWMSAFAGAKRTNGKAQPLLMTQQHWHVNCGPKEGADRFPELLA
jgi:hypothetical protein